MSRDTNFILRHLGELEQLAEEVLADKQQLVDLDRTRNGNREALRALINHHQQGKTSHTKSWVCFGDMFIKLPGSTAQDMIKQAKSWVCFGDMFIKLPVSTAQDMIKQDQTKLGDEFDRLHKELRPKVAKLRDMEGQKEAKGFDLTALSQDEIKTLGR